MPTRPAERSPNGIVDATWGTPHEARVQPEEKVKEKAWVIAVAAGTNGLDITGLDELNESLARGYRIVRFERLSADGAEPALAFVVASKRFRRRKGK